MSFNMKPGLHQAVGHRAKVYTTQKMIVTGLVEGCDGHIVHLTNAQVRFTGRDHPGQKAPRHTTAADMFLLLDQCSGWTAVDSL